MMREEKRCKEKSEEKEEGKKNVRYDKRNKTKEIRREKEVCEA